MRCDVRCDVGWKDGSPVVSVAMGYGSSAAAPAGPEMKMLKVSALLNHEYLKNTPLLMGERGAKYSPCIRLKLIKMKKL